ncbi:hypothetical protein [Streptomyces sp. NPDC001750]|uniref:hypothetical protein n=1 Tax=unclassified Streptomyces TaxID=2593676 RepID=UPI00367DAF14
MDQTNVWHAANEGPGRLRLDWDAPVVLGSVRLVFDDDVDEYFNDLHPHRTPFEIMPELVRDYRGEVRVSGAWQRVAGETGNRRRHRVHRSRRARSRPCGCGSTR